MGKVITVWGSPGSGKSMFCCILAKALTRDKRKAIIINADMNVPMLPVWLPEQIIQTNTSIGQVLSSVEIDTSLVASHVTVLKNYPFIGMMGYAAGENPLSYPEVKYTMVLQLIHAAAKLVDFVILDCSTSMTNVFTPAAIEAGDVVIRILTPDLKGINYLKAHQPLLVDERFRFSEHMTFAGLARPFHALDEMGYIIGGFDGLLPYQQPEDEDTQTKRLKQISDAAFQRQDIDEIESLALALRKEIDAALQPFYMGHMCLYVTPECFDDPPKTPEVYNDATACVWRDGTWQLLEDTSKGFLLFVQSKSKEEAAA